MANKKPNNSAVIAAVVAIAAIALVAVPILAISMFIQSVVSNNGAATGSHFLGLDDCVNGDSRSRNGALTAREYPSEEEVAATIYAQAQGLGLGDTGALIGIATGLVESGLRNGVIGDYITEASNLNYFRIGKVYGQVGDMTDSRGAFQQRMSWAPKGTAWSGQKFSYAESALYFSNLNPQTGKKDAQNPWSTGTRWAIADPRMDIAQTSNMFFLGGAGGQRGLEDVLASDKKIKNSLTPIPEPGAFTDEQMGVYAQKVQASAFPEKYAQRMDDARKYMALIQSGEIAVPAYQPPTLEIGKQASTYRVKNAIAKSNAAAGTTDTGAAVPTIAGDGVILIGDSVMQGLLAKARPTDEMFGGPVIRHAMRSIRLSDVLRADTFGVGGTDPQGRKKTPLAEWRRDLSSPDTPSRIIVELGTNGGGTREDIDEFMTLAGDKQVFWFSQHYGPSQPFNDTLLQAAAVYPNLNIIDISTVDGIDTTSKNAHPWIGAQKDPRLPMWKVAMDAISGARAPRVIQSLACGGTNAYIGDIQAPSLEAAQAVRWALSKVGGTYDAGPGQCTDLVDGTAVNTPKYLNATSTHFNCSGLTYMAYKQAGYDWPMQSSSYQWGDSKHIQLIPSSEAQPGDLVFFRGSAGDGMAAGHVALITSVEGEGQVVEASGCSSGIVTSPLKSGRGQEYLYPLDPNVRSASKADAGTTSDWNKAWVGRVIDTSPLPGAGQVSDWSKNVGRLAAPQPDAN